MNRRKFFVALSALPLVPELLKSETVTLYWPGIGKSTDLNRYVEAAEVEAKLNSMALAMGTSQEQIRADFEEEFPG